MYPQKVTKKLLCPVLNGERQYYEKCPFLDRCRFVKEKGICPFWKGAKK